MDIENWKEEYLVGIESIDEQHQKLFSQMDALTLALYEGEGSNTVEKLIDFLEEYTDYHFNHEEELMMKYAFPDMPAHIKQHEKFKSILFSFRSEFNSSGPSQGLALRLEKEIINWYKNHILVTDKKMSAHLKNRIA